MNEELDVLFDGYWLTGGPPSGRNVLASIIPAWLAEFPRDAVRVAVPKGRAVMHQYNPALEGAELVELKGCATNHGAWVLTTLGSAGSAGSAILSQNFTPLFVNQGVARITFLHDAIFKRRPEWFTRRERIYLSGVSMSLRRADLVVTSSIYEAREISRTWPRLRAQVAPVGLTVPADLAKQPTRPMAELNTGRPYVLSVGRVNIRKNIGTLIRAFEMSETRRTHDLFIIGTSDGRVERLNYGADHVFFLGEVSDARLASLYCGADLFVFPSLDEGFGLPLVEAAYFGASVIASDIGPFREIDQASGYFDPTSAESIALSMDAAVSESRSEQINLPTWVDIVSSMRRLVGSVVKC